MDVIECNAQEQRVLKFRELVKSKTEISDALDILRPLAKAADKDGQEAWLIIDRRLHQKLDLPCTVITDVEIARALVPVFEKRALEIVEKIKAL